MDIKNYTLNPPVRFRMLRLGLAIFAFSLFASTASAANDRAELFEVLTKLRADVDNATAVVTSIRTGNLQVSPDAQQGFLQQFVRYRDSSFAAVQFIRLAKENPSAKNLYRLRSALADLNIQLHALALWVHLGAVDRFKGTKATKSLNEIENCTNVFQTELFLYDSLVTNMFTE